ncbi:hypothetical protein O3M35_008876 [Rhynocoris fuscipes]|uniref:leucine--tRNA ligase n=1 Tax=Rhynocoris fuscipes TaxID=488301 RepID=A0AAW1D934_9HEMI
MFSLKVKPKFLDFKSLLKCQYFGINWPAFKFCTFNFNEDLTTDIKLKIETKWKNSLNKGGFNEYSLQKKFYVLSMFPYPSGNLHMGHVRVYTISDAISRFHRLNGKNVFQPIGFDAFGLPAENAARDRNIPPEKWTKSNITVMREQLKKLGFSFDWDREVITCSPEYYKFTQYLFLLLYKEGLVYREEAIVNWDPVDKTVLADEQVDSEGRSWRSGALVEKKILKQWFIRTTFFARSLFSGLDDPKLKDWKDIVALQKHWIGECDGASFFFKLFDKNGKCKGQIEIWMQYPEMISSAVFIAVASHSILGRKLIESNEQIMAKSPFSVQLFPIFVTDSLDYPEGCDIKVGIPSFSEKDANFAEKSGIQFSQEFCPQVNFEERLKLCNIAMENKMGGAMKSSKLRDWLISRQRHWGTPIPVVHCKECGPVPLSFDDLPVYLPSRDEPQSSVACPKCGSVATRETDTMDTFVDSAWYFLRYADPFNNEKPFCEEKVDDLLPVDVYVGGKEHAVLHLYYARFICHFLHSVGMLKFSEPFERLLVQGMVTGKTYIVKNSGKYLKKEDVIENEDGSLIEKDTKNEVVVKWEKMSKSRFNGVEPCNVLEEYGIDTTRLLILADVAPTSSRRWSDDTFPGILNWQKRLWSLMNMFLECRTKKLKDNVTEEEELRLYDARNFYIKGTTFNYSSSHQLSVAISKMQGLTNSLKKCSKNSMCNSLEFERTFASLIIMLYPMAPHFSSELWSRLQNAPGRLDLEERFIDWSKPVLQQSWPSLDPDYLLSFICKVNNAIKAIVKLPYKQIKSLSKTDALDLALKQEKVHSFITGCDILGYEFQAIDSYDAVINILIDHLQKRKIQNQR